MNLLPTENPHSAALPDQDDDPLLTVGESARKLGVSVPTFWRRVADGTYPKPLKPSKGCSRWPRSEIAALLENMKRQRSQAA